MKNIILKNPKENIKPCLSVVKFLLIITICLTTNYNIYGQTNDTLFVSYRVNYKDALALHNGESTDPNGIPGPNYTKDTALNNLLNKYNIILYAPYYSKGVLNLSLKNYYGIIIKGDTQNFGAELSKLNLTNGIETLQTYLNIPVLDDNKSFKIFPNPANHFINIDYPKGSTDWEISVLDMNGKLVFQTNKPISSISVGDWINGVYFIVITSSKSYHYENHKIIINH